MKKIEKIVAKKNVKRSTTNYPPAPHMEFCKRCYAHNGGCPNTGTHRKDHSCNI